MCLCVYVRMRVYDRLSVGMCVCACMYMYMYVCEYVCMSVCVCVYECVCMCVYMCLYKVGVFVMGVVTNLARVFHRNVLDNRSPSRFCDLRVSFNKKVVCDRLHLLLLLLLPISNIDDSLVGRVDQSVSQLVI